MSTNEATPEHWVARYEQAGYRVLAPAYPGFYVEVEARRGRGDQLGADQRRPGRAALADQGELPGAWHDSAG